jgi:hypothetical protein
MSRPRRVVRWMAEKLLGFVCAVAAILFVLSLREDESISGIG